MIGALAEQIRRRGGIRRLLKTPIVRNALLLYGVQFSSYVFPLLTLPFLSRVLQPEKLGLVFFAQSFIWYFITLSDYGFGLTATRRVAVHRDNPQELSRIFSAVMSTKLMLLAAGFVLMEGIVFAAPKLRPEAALFTVSYLTVIGSVLFPVWFFQGMQRLEQVAFRDFVSKASALVLLFAVVRTEDDYVRAAAIQSGGMVIAGLAGWTQIRKIAPIVWRWPDWHAIRGELIEGWPVFISMAALAVTASTNIFILGLWAAPEEVGYFSSAYRVVVAIRAAVSPLVSVLYPHLSHMVSQDKERVVRFLRGAGLLMPAPFVAISLFLALGAPWVVPVVFGESYLPTIPIMQILAFSPFLLALSHNYSTYYMLAFGYDGQWSRIVLWGTALNFAVLFPLMWTMKPSYAVAVTLLAVDAFGVGAAYLFFRRTAAPA